MDVAPGYTLFTLFTLFVLFKLLYTAKTIACMPIYIVWEGLILLEWTDELFL